MQPVHLYLAAWVAGGTLLGTVLLLQSKKPSPPLPAPADPAPGAPANAAQPPPPAERPSDTPRLLAFSLIGLGLGGLAGTLLGWPTTWTAASALTAAATLPTAARALS